MGKPLGTRELRVKWILSHYRRFLVANRRISKRVCALPLRVIVLLYIIIRNVGCVHASICKVHKREKAYFIVAQAVRIRFLKSLEST